MAVKCETSVVRKVRVRGDLEKMDRGRRENMAEGVNSGYCRVEMDSYLIAAVISGHSRRATTWGRIVSILSLNPFDDQPLQHTEYVILRTCCL